MNGEWEVESFPTGIPGQDDQQWQEQYLAQNEALFQPAWDDLYYRSNLWNLMAEEARQYVAEPYASLGWPSFNMVPGLPSGAGYYYPGRIGISPEKIYEPTYDILFHELAHHYDRPFPMVKPYSQMAWEQEAAEEWDPEARWREIHVDPGYPTELYAMKAMRPGSLRTRQVRRYYPWLKNEQYWPSGTYFAPAGSPR